MSNTYKHKRRGKNNRMWTKYYNGEVSREEVRESDPTLWFSWLDYTPSEWNNIFHERPFRRKNKKLSKDVIKSYNEYYYDEDFGWTNSDTEDDIIFPQTHKKPHIYYW